jgi:excisionase family DNA binding protein
VPAPPLYYTARDFATVANIGMRKVQRWCESGEIPAVKLGSCWYIPAEWLFPLLPPDHPDRREADRQP